MVAIHHHCVVVTVVEVFLNNGTIIDKGFFISINIVNIEGK